MFLRNTRQMTTRLLGLIHSSVLAALFVLLATAPAVHAAKPLGVAEVGVMVNINQANAVQLSEALSGVGIVKAEAIVAYRASNGKFKTADDLIKVKGIGQSILDKNRQRIKI